MISRIIGLLLTLVSLDAAAVDPDYAESVALTGYSSDGAMSFDVRIARFPGEARGTLWMYVFVDGEHYSLVDNNMELTHAEATDVAAAAASFAVQGTGAAHLMALGRDTSQMTAELRASGQLHATGHPEPGSGSIGVSVTAAFDAGHEPIKVRPGRLEVMGSVTGTITVAGKPHDFTLLGKWHEQTGVRPSFAPAFTYLFVQSAGSGIMAVKHAAGAWGYVMEDGKVSAVTDMKIDAYGAQARQFALQLDDGRRIEGSAMLLREVSVPIEGRRRPGATVLVASDLGRLSGVLNDWDPDGAATP